MSVQAAEKGYRQIRSLKDDKFDVDDIQNYSLSLLVGIRDFQICVVDSDNRVLFVEDVRLEQVKTINTRIKVLQDVFDDHHFLKAGFWKKVRLVLKTHKFTLVPDSHFIAEAKGDYLAVGSEIRTKIEDVFSFNQDLSGVHNVFAGDKRLIAWVKSVYKNKDVEILHQGTPFIEGLLNADIVTAEKAMYCLVDRGILHVVVGENKGLIYYNQFAARKSEDFLKYIMLVFKELGLKQKVTPVIFWGIIKDTSPHLELLKKYIRNISLGTRPSNISFGIQFNNIPEHLYFDLFNIHLC